jgi:selenocysteine lyase/cysteine desulfurase
VGWEHAATHRGVRIVEIPMPSPAQEKSQILDLVRSHITDRTRVCSFSHVCTITGFTMPLADIASITRPRGILLVCDGAQAPGMLDVNVEALGVDTYASSSHKWMLASKGSGLLYVRDAVRNRIQPVFLFSGDAPYTASTGTRNVAQILGHGVAMSFHESIGKARIESRCRQLSNYLRERLSGIPKIRLLTPAPEELSSAIVSVSLEEVSNQSVAAALRAEDFFVKVIPKAEYNGLRFSTHIYNSEAELDRFASALRRLL